MVMGDQVSAGGSLDVRRVDWGSVALYLALVFALSWGAFIGLRALGVPFVLRTAAGMLGPAASMLLTRLLRREGFADGGLRLSSRGGLHSAYLYGYAVPLLLLGAGVVLALLVGGQHWALEENWRALIGRPPRSSAMVMALLPVVVILALTVNVLVDCIATTGEELGWRGHLLIRLSPLGAATSAVAVGVVWGLWHAPLIALDGYEYGIRSWLLAPYFCLFTIPLALVVAWLRFSSGSVWPCVLAHAAINAPAGLIVIALSRPGNTLIAPPVGLLGTLPFWAFAAWLVVSGRLRVATEEPVPPAVAAIPPAGPPA
jgi:membrane protease YdiL (CAAX protease family)